MAKELYVGHISEQATEDDLRKLFSLMGPVTSVHLIVNQETGEFKRCGYVRMLAEVDLKEVVETLDGTWLIDRCIVVSIAKPQKDRPAKTPYIKRKPMVGARSTPAETVKTGSISAEKEAARKFRPSVAKDAPKSERPAPSAKRTGRPASGRSQGDGPRPPAKGRR